MNKMKKQTAVEWLVEQCPRINTIASLDVIEQANEMFEEQMIYACNQTEFEDEKLFGTSEVITKGELYYNETYGGDK